MILGLGLLKFRNGDKLHLSNGPGIWTWAFSVGCAILGLAIALLATDCIIKKCCCIMGSLVIALMNIGEWKDCVMDQSKNVITLTRSNWYRRLCSQVSALDIRMIPLSSVSSVETRGNHLMLVLFSSATIVIGTHTNLRHLHHLQDEVSSFLRVGRVERVHWEGLEHDWYLEFWEELYSVGELEETPVTTQHSGVKVLVQP